MPTDDLTAAECQRRLRRRRKLSLSVATAEVPLPLVEALIEAGLLSENRVSDPECLGAALTAAAKGWAAVGRPD